MEFDAVVARGRGGGLCVSLPAEAADVFATRARFPVRAWFNEAGYRGSTMPMGDGTFGLGLSQSVRAEAGIGLGDTLRVVVERDDSERGVEVPADLTAALEASGLADRFAAMAYTHRKEYARWIVEAKRPETRSKRLAQAVTRIGNGERFS
ncbi:MAG: YdeI/OmpD-associated family protein [Acidimicrobiales bacterium]